MKAADFPLKNDGRGDWIRTSDLHTPSVMRYQAALRPDWPAHLGRRHQSRQGAAGGQVARRRRKGKAGKWVGRVLTALLAVPALYLVAALIGSLVPVNRGWTEPAQGTTVYLADNGIHADIVMPVEAQGLDWAPLIPASDFAAADSGRALDRLRIGRAAGLSRHADLVGHHAADDLVGAGRRQARDARRICAEPRLRGARRSGCGPRNIAGCGRRSAPISRSMPAAARSGSTIRATVLRTLSTARPARPARSAPATAGSPTGFGSPG